MYLEISHTDSRTRGKHVDFVAHTELAGDEGTRDHGAESLDRECTIDREPGNRGRRFRLGPVPDLDKSALEVVDTCAGSGADRNYRSAFQERSGYVLFDLAPRQLEKIFIDEVGFGERDD